MTVLEAIKIAEPHKNAPKLGEIVEYPDRFVMWYDDGTDDEFIISRGISVMKETGEVGSFFPPDFDEDYLKSGIEWRVPKKYRTGKVA